MKDPANWPDDPEYGYDILTGQSSGWLYAWRTNATNDSVVASPGRSGILRP